MPGDSRTRHYGELRDQAVPGRVRKHVISRLRELLVPP